MRPLRSLTVFLALGIALAASAGPTAAAGPGVVACVVGASDRKRFVEADLLIEADLAGRLGGTYRWTTGDRTWAGGGFGELALLDVVTHEWGHFAGSAT